MLDVQNAQYKHGKENYMYNIQNEHININKNITKSYTTIGGHGCQFKKSTGMYGKTISKL